MSIRRYISTDFYRHNTDRKTMFWRHKNTVFCFVNTMLSLRQTYVFTSSILCFQKPHVPLWQSQSYASPPTKCHIDGQQVPHRQAASPTSTGNKSHIDGQQVPHWQRRGCSPPRTVTKYLYTHPFSPLPISTFFAKKTSPPHPTPRKARYTKGLKPVRCCPNTSLTPH